VRVPTGPPALRPLSVGEILDASFKVYGRNFVNMAKAILVVAVPFGVISALINASVSSSSSVTISSGASTTTIDHQFASDLGLLALDVVLDLVAAAIATAVIYRVVGDAYLGNAPSWRHALREGVGKAPSVLWVTVLTFFAYVAMFVPVGLVVGLVAAFSNLGALTVLIGVMLGIPTAACAVWFWVIYQLAIPSLLLEGFKGTRAFGRSRRLVQHFWWRCFGCLLLITLIVGIVSDIFSGVLVVVLYSLAHTDLARIVAEFLAGVIDTVVFTPIVACALVVLSIDLRVRKEGYDLQLLAEHLGSRPGTSALSFLPPPPAIWGAPPGGAGPPGGFAPPGSPAGWWSPPGSPAGWLPPSGPPTGWSPPASQSGWSQPGSSSAPQPPPPPFDRPTSQPSDSWGLRGPRVSGQPYPPGWGPAGLPGSGQPYAPGWGPNEQQSTQSSAPPPAPPMRLPPPPPDVRWSMPPPPDSQSESDEPTDGRSDD